MKKIIIIAAIVLAVFIGTTIVLGAASIQESNETIARVDRLLAEED